MKTFLKIFFGVIIIGVFGYTIYYLYNKSKTKPVLYDTTMAFETTIIKKTVATGSVDPRKKLKLNHKYRELFRDDLW